MCRYTFHSSFFFFNDTATTEIYTLSLHDALPISYAIGIITLYVSHAICTTRGRQVMLRERDREETDPRSEEHTSELQSPCNLVCRLLLEKKKKATSTSSSSLSRSARSARTVAAIT